LDQNTDLVSAHPFLALLVFVAVAVIISTPQRRRNRERERQRQAEQDALDAAYIQASLQLQHKVGADGFIVEPVEVDGRSGILALANDGRALRFIAWHREGAALACVDDQTLSTTTIRATSINQPDVASVVTHREKVPVAVAARRSAGGRALVGGLVAGPAGAVIGGASGLNAGSKIKMVATERHETVYSKGHPVMVIEFDDLVTPRRSVTFADANTTDDWLSRIHAAMQRARS
jgi:hypothetical protein